MVTIRCAGCGEELMGAVNRCWRCGARFEIPTTGENGPPQTLESTDSLAATAKRAPEAAHAELESASQGSAPSAGPARGSASSPPARRRPPQDSALGGVLGAACLGLFSLLAVTRIGWGGALLAVVGMGFGLWGLRSRHPAWAWLGILLCLVTLAIALFQGAVAIYTAIHGISPFETLEPLEP